MKEPLRWYQFRIRDLFIITAIAAVFCSIGASLDWVLALYYALNFVLSGLAGMAVARKRAGFAKGIYVGFPLAIAALTIIFMFNYCSWGINHRWLWYSIPEVIAIVGGVLGGYFLNSCSNIR
jgi:hypothetical protein